MPTHAKSTTSASSSLRARYRRLREGKPVRLTEDQVRRLEEIGFLWAAREAQWDEMFARLVRYKEGNDDCNVPKGWSEDPSLGSWVNNQRQKYRNGKLSEERIRRLESIGFEWSLKKTRVRFARSGLRVSGVESP